MITLLRKYMSWLHTRWPAGSIERLPQCEPDGSTRIPNLYIVGDITGIPLLKFSADSGARAVSTIQRNPSFIQRNKQPEQNGARVYDLVIIGAGVSGMAAAVEAQKQGLSYCILEATEAFSTIVNFPKGKPIYTYPTEMTPQGDLQFSEQADVKESLIQELYQQTLDQGIAPENKRVERVTRKGKLLEVVVPESDNLLAHGVIVAIGRSGNFRKLGVPGEDLDKVSNRLHDPKDYCDKHVLVVGGGDSALESAIAIASCGGHVTLSYRKPEFSRPKPDNIEKLQALSQNTLADVGIEQPVSERVTTSSGAFRGKDRREGSVRLLMASHVERIEQSQVVMETDAGETETINNDAVFSMIGREAPLEFFRRSGIRINGEWRKATWFGFLAFMAFCFWLYHWKSSKPIPIVGPLPGWLNPNPGAIWTWIAGWGASYKSAIEDPATLYGTLRISMSDATFTYALAYSLAVVIFGIRRIRKRKTPYIKVQTITLMLIQCIPLFVLPEIILPLLGHNGFFETGLMRSVADALFPIADYGHGREYWRAYGFILAWPLMAWNFFANEPLWAWLILGSLQTFVAIPLLIYFWGKGAYCGWICSCGALAETMGDDHRHKMLHGPRWNRLNMVGQVLLAWSFILLFIRILGWVFPSSSLSGAFDYLAFNIPLVNYKWFLDIMLAGAIGYGCYFWFSGRVWCRFACPLAALMHIYARFSRFRIFADKKKCISCNVCTAVCHQGIDIMNFANKGMPMEDPECVRCSACVQSCPTGVLTFGQIDRQTGVVKSLDVLPASPVQMAESARIHF